MRILITGINGFTGGYLLQYLYQLADKIDIIGAGRQSNCIHPIPVSTIHSFTYVSLDLQNKEEVADMMNRHRPEYLVHLASTSSVGYSWQYPQETYVNNTLMFLNLIEQVRTSGITCRILSIGSGEEYGKVEEKDWPIKETMLLKPNNPYAVARVSQEMIADLYVKGYGMDIVMTRSFNHIGAGQSDQFVISSFAKKLVEASHSKEEIKTITTGDISIARDFLDVRDVVRAYHLLLVKGIKGEVYNVCSGKGIMLSTMLNMMCRLLGIEVSFVQDDQLLRPLDNKMIIGNHDKLSSITGWKPEIYIQQTLSEILTDWKVKLHLG